MPFRRQCLLKYLGSRDAPARRTYFRGLDNEKKKKRPGIGIMRSSPDALNSNSLSLESLRSMDALTGWRAPSESRTSRAHCLQGERVKMKIKMSAGQELHTVCPGGLKSTALSRRRLGGHLHSVLVI